MIALTTEKGEVLRFFAPGDPTDVAWFRAHGFVSEKTMAARRIVRIRGQAKQRPTAAPICRFRIEGGEPRALSGCRIDRQSDQWRLATAEGNFLFKPAQLAEAVTIVEPDLHGGSSIFQTVASVLILAVLAAGIGRALLPHEDKKEVADEQKTIVIPNVKTKPPPPKVVEKAPEPVKPNAIVQKKKDAGAAVQNKLGFLSLLGKKDLKKAMGGMPTSAEHRSPGAGAGGDKGSGGQMLAGLGAGLKQTTVGHTGVAGLGGIGNAGAGGGEGGYGKSYVGSGGAGGGKKLSDVRLAKDVELDGGLDRAVIDATIAKYLSQVRACYERGLNAKPGLAGQVTVDFEIAATGMLSYAKVKSSSLEYPETENCIAHAMLAWQFPKPVGGTLVKVNYPFTLKPASYL